MIASQRQFRGGKVKFVSKGNGVLFVLEQYIKQHPVPRPHQIYQDTPRSPSKSSYDSYYTNDWSISSKSTYDSSFINTWSISSDSTTSEGWWTNSRTFVPKQFLPKPWNNKDKINDWFDRMPGPQLNPMATVLPPAGHGRPVNQ